MQPVFIDAAQLEVSDEFADAYHEAMILFDPAQGGIRDFDPINQRLRASGYHVNQRVSHLARMKLLYQGQVKRETLTKKVGKSSKVVGEIYVWQATPAVTPEAQPVTEGGE